MTSIPIAIPGMTLDNTFGAVFLGVMGSCILFGVTSLQAYLYFHHFQKDSLLHKLSVACLWCLDTVHLCCTLHVAYYYLVSNFGLFTLNIVWSIKAQVLINIIVIVMVQSLYTYRVWMLGGYHRGLLGYITAFIVACGFLFGVISSYKIFNLSVFPDVQSISWIVYASFGSATIIDFLIAMAMCYYLYKSRGTQSSLNSKISTIIQYSLGSGLLTSTCSLAGLIAFAFSPNCLIYLGLEFLLTKLYVGSFLAMLNARKREECHHPTDSEFVLSKVAFKTDANQSPNSVVSERKYPWQLDIEGRPDVETYPHEAGPSPRERPSYAHQW